MVKVSLCDSSDFLVGELVEWIKNGINVNDTCHKVFVNPDKLLIFALRHVFWGTSVIEEVIISIHSAAGIHLDY